MTQLATVPTQETALSASLGFEPQCLKEAWRLAEIVVASGLAPKSVRTPEAAMVMMMTGRELGLTAMQSLRSIHVVEGKPLLSSDLMLALALRQPSCEYFACTETTDVVASFEAKRKGQPATKLSFTMAQATAAKLADKDNWKKYPASMLRARAISALARLVFPDAFVGVYEEDEIAPPRPVESDVRQVPEPRATPPDPLERVAKETHAEAGSPAFWEFADAMRKAMSLSELQNVAARIAPAGLPEEERKALRIHHATNRARLTPPAGAGDSWEPARG